jgi:hypothetical protein
MARSRPSNDGREPLGQETAPKTSFRSNFLAQRPARRKRRPRHFSFLFNSLEKYASLPIREEARQNRRAFGTSAGEKPAIDEHSCSGEDGFSPVAGDPGLPAVLLSICGISFRESDRLLARVGGRVAWRFQQRRRTAWPIRTCRIYGLDLRHLRDLWAN